MAYTVTFTASNGKSIVSLDLLTLAGKSIYEEH